MKIFFLLLLPLVLLAGHSARAQRTHAIAPGPGPGPTSLPPGELFVGTWEWASAGEVLRITFTRNPAYTSPRYPDAGAMNVVTGQYLYTRNGVTVDQSATTGPRPYSLFCAPNGGGMRMSFYDHALGKYGQALVAFVPGNPNQLTWQLRPKETMYVYPDVAPPDGFTVPTDLTLTRQP